MDRTDSRLLGPYKQNRLQQLRGFIHAAQLGSISRAAARMMLSQPSVSLQIQALERELGVKVFERRGPTIRLTPAGRRLLDLALPLVEGIDGLTAEFAEAGDAVRGPLDIAAGEATILHVLPPVVTAFTRAHPAVDLRLQNVTGREGLSRLRRGDVDFAVGPMPDVPDDIAFLPLFESDPMLITPTDHPLARSRRITLEAVARHPLILPPPHLTTTPQISAAFRQRGLRYRVSLHAGGWEVIKRYVELGLGISIVTAVCLTGQERLAAISMRRYLPRRTYGIVHRRGQSLTRQARLFIEMLQPHARGGART